MERFSYFSFKACVMGTYENRLSEAILISTHYTCTQYMMQMELIGKIYPELFLFLLNKAYGISDHFLSRWPSVDKATGYQGNIFLFPCVVCLRKWKQKCIYRKLA